MQKCTLEALRSSGGTFTDAQAIITAGGKITNVEMAYAHLFDSSKTLTAVKNSLVNFDMMQTNGGGKRTSVESK